MKLIPVSDAKAKLTELVRDSGSEDVILLRYGRPAAVLMSTDRFDALMERIEDLEDSLAVAESKGEPTDPAGAVFERLGIRVPTMA
jgi:prevent-host-death family protein